MRTWGEGRKGKKTTHKDKKKKKKKKKTTHGTWRKKKSKKWKTHKGGPQTMGGTKVMVHGSQNQEGGTFLPEVKKRWGRGAEKHESREGTCNGDNYNRGEYSREKKHFVGTKENANVFTAQVKTGMKIPDGRGGFTGGRSLKNCKGMGRWVTVGGNKEPGARTGKKKKTCLLIR